MYKKYYTILALCLYGILLSSFTIDLNKTNKVEELNTYFDTIPHTTNDTYFIQAHDEIVKMLDGEDSLNVKRAQFLMEWAYTEGELDYKEFCHHIDSVVLDLNAFIKLNGIENYKTAGNFALFEYFTKSSPLNGNKAFSYDFKDFSGSEDYRQLFVSKVMKTHRGQCVSLPMYYKILSEELGAESFIAIAPNHMYIKHIAENGKWVNIELTNGHFATDAWMISSMDISAEAIKNRVYLDALDNKQTICTILTSLAMAYQRKYGYDYFALSCVDKALEYYPQYIPALAVKFNIHKYIGQQYLKEYGQVSSDFMDKNYKSFKDTQLLIENLGYRELSPENYESWLNSMEEELEKQAQSK